MIWNFDPVAISFFGLKVYWYGILFALAIISGLQTMRVIYRKEKMPPEHLYDQLFNLLIGIIIGARLVECLFYYPQYYLKNPHKIFAIWEGALASHGGALGSIVVVFLYTQKYKLSFIWLFDRFVISIAIFSFFIRVANFLNSEVLGIPTSVPWAVTFRQVDMLPRHPVQLYEAFTFLGIFVLLVYIYNRSKIIHKGFLLGLFLSLTFVARFLLEYLKERQASYAYDFSFSVGQLLSIPFIIVGIILLVRAFKKSKEIDIL